MRIERACAKELKGAVRARIDQFLQSTGLGLSLGAFGISAKLQLDPRVDPLPALHSLLDLPLRLGESGSHRALVVFDEFQDIVKVGSMDALLRSHIQHQGEVASYIFSGSEPGMMRQLFEDKARPLYGAAAPLRLHSLRDEDIAAYVSERFQGSNRAAGEGLNPLLRTAKGHPQRAIYLAHRLWEEVPEGETATFEHWQRAPTRRRSGRARAGVRRPLAELRHLRAEGAPGRTRRRWIAAARGGAPPARRREDHDPQRGAAARRDRRGRAPPTASTRSVDPLFAEWIDSLRAPRRRFGHRGRTGGPSPLRRAAP